MSNEQFIGRGEKLVKKILDNPWGIEGVRPQVNIRRVLPVAECDLLDEEILKHNFDFLCIRRNLKHIVVEVNYKHGEKAAQKARTIFEPLLKQYDYDYLTIDDYDCISIFKPHSKPTYDDIIDMTNQFKKAGIKIG